MNFKKIVFRVNLENETFWSGFPTLCAGTSENIIVTKRPFICLFSSAGCNRPCIFHSRKFKVETQTPPLLLRSASKGGGGMQSYSPALLLKVHFKQKGCPSHHQIPNKSLLTIFTFLTNFFDLWALHLTEIYIWLLWPFQDLFLNQLGPFTNCTQLIITHCGAWFELWRIHHSCGG